MKNKIIKKQAPWFVAMITTLASIIAPVVLSSIDKKHESNKVKEEHAHTLKEAEQKHNHSIQGYLHSIADKTSRVEVLTTELALAQRWENMYNHVISIAASRCPPRSIFDAENLMCTPTKRPHH